MMLLVNAPVPVPSTVLVDNDTVGLAVVLQQTPLKFTLAPPSLLTFPPLEAVVFDMLLMAVVVTVGITVANVVSVISAP